MKKYLDNKIKITFVILYVFGISVLNFYCQDKKINTLYPIYDGNLWGYIDKTGKKVIKSKFLSASDFSDGLAAVRFNGTYGYINERGTFIIPPQYDFALNFKNGIAKVFIEGKSFFINIKGNILFNHSFKEISEFNNESLAIVETESKKFGLIDISGKLILDTIFKSIVGNSNNVFVVTGLNHSIIFNDSEKNSCYESGVIDFKGNWIVPYGKFDLIANYKNGYAKVFNYGNRGVIDLNGNLLFELQNNKWEFNQFYGHFVENIAIIDIINFEAKNSKSIKTFSKNKYPGAINLKGDLIFSNSDWVELTNFSSNRAFAKEKNGNWKLIDSKGNLINENRYLKILQNSSKHSNNQIFQNGKAFVKTNEGWGAIDTNGNFIIEPINLSEGSYDHLYRFGDIIIIKFDVSIKNLGYSYLYGFWDIGNNIYIYPQFQSIEINKIENDLIYVVQNDKMGYINREGLYVWKNNSKELNSKLNIDVMNRGYYYASSIYLKSLAGLGGWAKSENISKPITPEIIRKSNNFQIVLDPHIKTKWANTYEGIKLFVINCSKDTFFFDAQDSRLNMLLQAQDRNGVWKDIEYLPTSWCGNSNHLLMLKPSEYWEFDSPKYYGQFRTKIRAQLLYKKEFNQKTNDTIYSNVINGFVNPGQFWNIGQYYPKGIMDSY